MTSAQDRLIEMARDAAAVVRSAQALVITAGAGMGVDSGLPDFRGAEGFWRAYPAYRALGLDFIQLANPGWFDRDPELAWGFYGHRLHLYRRTEPHEGFALLRRWAAALPQGAFVFTSNVDGQFQRAGFDEARILEVHGAIDWVQCTKASSRGPTRCRRPVERADLLTIDVDEVTLRARPPLPTCACGALLRPNILMFGDSAWDDARSRAQHARFSAWLSSVRGAAAKLVVLECGAGKAIPTVRHQSESLARSLGGTLVRINPGEAEVPPGHLGLPFGALPALKAIAAAL